MHYIAICWTVVFRLLIEPYGIEMMYHKTLGWIKFKLLIEPYGIEICV